MGRALRRIGLALALAACSEPPPAPPSGAPPARPEPTAPERRARDAGNDAQVFAADGCAIEEAHRFRFAVGARPADGPPALIAGDDRFAVAWRDVRAGRPDLFVAGFRSSGAPVPEHPLVESPALESAPRLARWGGGLVAVWAEGADLWMRRQDPELRPIGAPAPLTATPGEVERTLDARVLDARLFVAWLARTPRGGRSHTQLGVFTEGGRAIGAPRTLALPDGRAPTGVALGALDGRPAAALVDPNDGRVWLRTMDADGAPRGEAIRLDADANADGSIDAAFAGDGGAVLFGARVGVRSQLRFVPLDANGAPLASERVIGEEASTASAVHAGLRDGGIAALDRGYAVAYRALDGSNGAELRFGLLTTAGARILELAVAPTTLGGGPVRVRVSDDGRVGIAWAEHAAGGTVVRGAMARCWGLR